MRSNAIILLFLLASATNGQAGAWKRTLSENSKASYEAFVSKYPTSEFAAEAKNRIMEIESELLWNEAVSNDSLAAYDLYAALYPDGPHFASAMAKVDSLEWEATTTSRSLHNYRYYIEDHPDSRFVTNARQWIENLEARARSSEARTNSQVNELVDEIVARINPFKLEEVTAMLNEPHTIVSREQMRSSDASPPQKVKVRAMTRAGIIDVWVAGKFCLRLRRPSLTPEARLLFEGALLPGYNGQEEAHFIMIEGRTYDHDLVIPE
ncbi:MAG: hypothetical protein IPL52_04155 [Flavobacteriales bacterium]|nr:hypothetical protein [Flavobacteriales bacterium]